LFQIQQLQEGLGMRRYIFGFGSGIFRGSRQNLR
jgi:hypothetical protein